MSIIRTYARSSYGHLTSTFSLMQMHTCNSLQTDQAPELTSNTVPEGQSVDKLEPTPRTNYSIPRGENHIFGQLSVRSVWLRSPKQKTCNSLAVIWACSKTFEPNYSLQKLNDQEKDCGYGVFSMR